MLSNVRRASFLGLFTFIGATAGACGDDPFGPEDIVGHYGLNTIGGERFPVLIPPQPPPFRYLVFGGSLELNADRTFALTLIVRTYEYTADGSRILGVGGDVPETEVGTYNVVGHVPHSVIVDMTFSANGRFGLERRVTISDYLLRLQRPGDPEYRFECGCGRPSGIRNLEDGDDPG